MRAPTPQLAVLQASDLVGSPQLAMPAGIAANGVAGSSGVTAFRIG